MRYLVFAIGLMAGSAASAETILLICNYETVQRNGEREELDYDPELLTVDISADGSAVTVFNAEDSRPFTGRATEGSITGRYTRTSLDGGDTIEYSFTVDRFTGRIRYENSSSTSPYGIYFGSCQVAGKRLF